MEFDFDLTVIGSGPGGYKAAIAAAHLGAKVALVERDLPGGTCLNQGCIPKKTLHYLASLIEDVNALNGRGLIGAVKGDFEGAMAHKNQVVAGIRENFPVWLRRLGIRLFAGQAAFEAPHRIAVTANESGQIEVVTTAKTIIATGSRPIDDPYCPTDGKRILSSRDFMFSVNRLPASILCVGGGAIGCELGFLLNQFGSRVTIIDRADRLLNKTGIPERASDVLRRKFERLGINVKTGLSVAGTASDPEGVEVTLSDGSRERYEQVLVAIGRRPNHEQMGLENVGIEPDAEGFVPTNEYLQTACPSIYAVGDITRGPMTANAALHGAKIAALNAVKGNQVKHNYHRVPIVIDSALEIAAVGLSEELAEQAGFSPDSARANFGASPKARGRGDTEGFIEVVHDEETGQLLGGCIVGSEAGEQIHMLTAACHSQRGLWFFTDMNYSHPSWCEELENAIDPYASALLKSGQDLFRPGIFASSTDRG